MTRPAVITVADTIARSFLLSVEARGERPAIREKHLGVWKSTSWREWLQIAKDIAYALHAIGFKAGDVASIISNATPEWVFADMGVLCAGGVSSGIYPTDSAKQVEYLVNDSRTRVIFVEDEEQLDKVLVYPGRDAAFTLYDDDGESNSYRKTGGRTATLRWDDAAGKLTASGTLPTGQDAGALVQVVAAQPGSGS